MVLCACILSVLAKFCEQGLVYCCVCTLRVRVNLACMQWIAVLRLPNSLSNTAVIYQLLIMAALPQLCIAFSKYVPQHIILIY